MHPILLSASFLANSISMMLGGLLSEVLGVFANDFNRLPLLIGLISMMYFIPYIFSSRIVVTNSMQEELISGKLDLETSMGNSIHDYKIPESPQSSIETLDYMESNDPIPTQKQRMAQSLDDVHLQEHVHTFS